MHNKVLATGLYTEQLMLEIEASKMFMSKGTVKGILGIIIVHTRFFGLFFQ